MATLAPWVDTPAPTAQPATAQAPADSMLDSNKLPSGSNEDIFNSLKPEYKPIMLSLLNGRMPPTGRNGLDKNFVTKMMIVGNQIDPNFDATVFKSRQQTQSDYGGSGVSGKKRSSINTAMAHLANLEQNYTGLNNGDTHWINEAENNALNGNLLGFGTKIGLGNKVRSTQGYLATANRNVSDLAGELATIFRTGGGMAEGDITREIKGLDLNQAPTAMNGQITGAVTDLQGKIESMVESYNQTMGTHKTVADFLDKKALATYERMAAGGFGKPIDKAQPSTSAVTVVRTGMYGGKKVTEYSDGSIK